MIKKLRICDKCGKEIPLLVSNDPIKGSVIEILSSRGKENFDLCKECTETFRT